MTNREMGLLIGLVVSLSAAVGLGLQSFGHGHGYGGCWHQRPGFGHMGPRGPMDGPSHGKFMQRMMQDADTNKDGFLTKDEMLAAHTRRVEQMFADLDTNHDGKLDADELAKGRELMRAKMMQRWQAERAGQTSSTERK